MWRGAGPCSYLHALDSVPRWEPVAVPWVPEQEQAAGEGMYQEGLGMECCPSWPGGREQGGRGWWGKQETSHLDVEPVGSHPGS